MKRPCRKGAMLWMVLALIMPMAWADSTQDALDTAENGFIAALLHQDHEALKGLLTSEFVYNTAQGGSLTKAALLQYLDAGQMRLRSMERSSVHTRTYGTMALVTGIYRVEALQDGEASVSLSRYLHVWQLQNGGWKLLARQVTYLRPN